jgi:hypothetical protein
VVAQPEWTSPDFKAAATAVAFVPAAAGAEEPARFVTGDRNREGELVRGRVLEWVVGKDRPNPIGELEGAVSALTVTPDGRWVVAAGELDNEPRLFDRTRARGPVRLGTPQPHAECVNAVAVWPGGRILVTAGDDSTVRFWDLVDDKKTLLGCLSTLAHPLDWVVYTPDGLFDSTDEGSQRVTWTMPGYGEVYPVERFYNACFRAGLLRQLARGERPRPPSGAGVGKRPAPRVEFLSPKAGEFGKPEADVVVRVTDRGGGIGPLVIRYGAAVLNPTQDKPVEGGKEFTFRVTLFDDCPELSASASNDDDSAGSEPVRLHLVYKEYKPTPRLYVLAVGVKEYSSGIRSLKYSDLDAVAIAEQFQTRSLPVFQDVKVRCLVDKDATRARIVSELAELAKATKPWDTLVLFLAGHGVVLDDHYFYYPYAMKEPRGAEEAGRYGLPAREIAEHLISAEAVNRIVILDTCAAGQVADELPTALRAAASRLKRDTGQLMIMATSAVGEAQESDALEHGVLTYTLLAGLGAVDRGPLANYPVSLLPDNKEKVVDAVDWFTYAAVNIGKLMNNPPKGSRTAFGTQVKQFPQLYIHPYFQDHPPPVLFSLKK